MQALFMKIIIFISAIITVKSEKKQPSSTKQLTRRRIISEFRDINKDNLTSNTPFNTSSVDECDIRLSPIEHNFLQWHFSFRGVPGSSFEDGCYHGRIMLDKDYPRKAPSICVLTPNGRWEVGKDICLSASSYHQETWDMKWNLRTLVMALRGHMLTQPREIGSISSTPDRHEFFAKLSRYYKCKYCSASHPMLLGDEMPPMQTSTPSNSNINSISNSVLNEVKPTIPKRPGKYTYPSTVAGDDNDEKKLQSLSSLTSKKLRKTKQQPTKNQTKNDNNDDKKVSIATYHPLVKIFVLLIPIFIHFLIQYFSSTVNTASSGVSTSQHTKKHSLFS